MSISFYDQSDLFAIGFKSVGSGCLISRKASIYSPQSITLGDHVRIDDFCILSGEISIGSFIHISAYSALYASFGIEIEDFVTISGRVTIYSQNDDYSGKYMTNPMLPVEFTNITGGTVVLKKHSIIGAGSIILPGVILNEGCCVAALSLVKTSLSSWTIYGGVPAKYLKKRNQDIIFLEEKLRDSFLT
ncbi:MAG: acyltransferase [Bacteroidetes bacterium]|nr:acyltransferase [Bacteroidota bacterium]